MIIDNKEEKSINARKIVEAVIKECGLEESNRSPDLVIAIGGDGTFLKALKYNKFNTDAIYVGIHTGHLGFLQEVKVEEIDKLFEIIKNEDYKIETLSIEQIEVVTKFKKLKYYALNEMVLRDEDLKTIKFDVEINNKYFERFAGDGIMISTPTGSTAYNLSSGGSVIYPSLKTLQLLPLSPLPISKHFSSLRNSVIVPENMTVSLIPEERFRDRTKIIIDGEDFQFSDVDKINVTTAIDSIKVLRFNNYDFWLRVNKKFLKFED